MQALDGFADCWGFFDEGRDAPVCVSGIEDDTNGEGSEAIGDVLGALSALLQDSIKTDDTQTNPNRIATIFPLMQRGLFAS